MKTLSIWEFEEYCNREEHTIYIYSTANQKNPPKNIKAISIYNCILFTYNPNSIILKNDRNNLCFTGIKSIIVHSNADEVGEAFEIICASSDQSKEESYTILEF